MYCPNSGLDFGLWKRALQNIGEDTTFLVVCNDGCTLTKPLQSACDTLRAFEFGGLTDSYDIKYHLQSYFLTFTKRAIPLVKTFFKSFEPYAMNRDTIIRQGEVGLSQFMLSNDIAPQPLYPWKKLTSKPLLSNSSWFHFDELQILGCPLLKRKRHPKKPTCRVFILAYDAQSFGIAKKISNTYKWAEAYMLKPMTPATALWEHSFFLDIPEFTEDYVGILGYKCSLRVNLSSLDKVIRDGLQGDVIHCNVSEKTVAQGTSQAHPFFNAVWNDVLAPFAYPASQARESFFSHFVAKRDVMQAYAETIKRISPTLLSHPHILDNANYFGKLKPDFLLKACGVPWYPHTPFLLERFPLPHFMKQGLDIRSLNSSFSSPPRRSVQEIKPKIQTLVDISGCACISLSNTPSQVLRAPPCGNLMEALKEFLLVKDAVFVVAENMVLTSNESTLLSAIKEATASAADWDFACVGPDITIETRASKYNNNLSTATGHRKSTNFFTYTTCTPFTFENAYMVSKRGLEVIHKHGLKAAFNNATVWINRFLMVSTREGLNNSRITLELKKHWTNAKQ
jgi:hypothetical protein